MTKEKIKALEKRIEDIDKRLDLLYKAVININKMMDTLAKGLGW